MRTQTSSFRQEIFGLFSFTVFCVYSWALLVFFWDLPAFFFYLGAWDILGYLSYQFTFALGESVLVSLLVAGLTRFVFKKSEIAAAGSWLVFSFAMSALVFKGLGGIAQGLAQTLSLSGFAAAQTALGIWAFISLALPLVSLKLSDGVKVARWTRDFLENLSVLSGLYVVLSLIAAAIVIYRNL